MEFLIQVLLLAAGFLMLIKGADWFVEGASGIADYFGVPQLVIGLTIVAMGTSAPETAVSIAAALQGNAGITIGNVVGSNILNIWIILGLTSVITSVAVARSTIRMEIPYMIAMTALLLVFGMSGQQVTWVEGLIFWAAFLAYLYYLFRMAKNNAEEADELSEKSSLKRYVVGMVAGLTLVIFGSDVTVDAATQLAKSLGLSDRFIGLTIVALGTSLPELFTSVSAAMKGKADIAIGNIVGSNIFNILFVVGTAALIMPVTFLPEFATDTLIAIAAGVMLLACVIRRKQLSRGAGLLMLASYGGYLCYLLR